LFQRKYAACLVCNHKQNVLECDAMSSGQIDGRAGR
jgi:hypothetical protein